MEKLNTIKVFLYVAAKSSWELHQIDVINAFLHGDIQKVYISPPAGMDAKSKVCRLKKAQYGLTIPKSLFY